MRQVLLGLLLAGAAHAQTGALSGRIVDSLQRPLGNATVSLPTLSLSTTSDTAGAFRLTVPSGSHRVTIRHIGYALIDTTMSFVANQAVRLEVTLKSIGYGITVQLDTVVSIDRGPMDPGMADFEANRAKGFGKFITHAELEKLQGRPLGNVVSQLQGLNVLRGYSSQAWVTSKRAPRSRCASLNTKRQDDMDRCLADEKLIYVPDRM
ncbi:MAG TPA: carboxypeptidase regulatory-like domain-containing protein, partial [Gemmatimonadaceae bacterium]